LKLGRKKMWFKLCERKKMSSQVRKRRKTLNQIIIRQSRRRIATSILVTLIDKINSSTFVQIFSTFYSIFMVCRLMIIVVVSMGSRTK
jgi:hypothetical protein